MLIPRAPPHFSSPIEPPHCSLCPPPQVQVLTGKDAGRQGLVTQVVRARNWVVVEGLNTVRSERGGVGGGVTVLRGGHGTSLTPPSPRSTTATSTGWPNSAAPTSPARPRCCSARSPWWTLRTGKNPGGGPKKTQGGGFRVIPADFGPFFPPQEADGGAVALHGGGGAGAGVAAHRPHPPPAPAAAP